MDYNLKYIKYKSKYKKEKLKQNGGKKYPYSVTYKNGDKDIIYLNVGSPKIFNLKNEIRRLNKVPSEYDIVIELIHTPFYNIKQNDNDKLNIYADYYAYLKVKNKPITYQIAQEGNLNKRIEIGFYHKNPTIADLKTKLRNLHKIPSNRKIIIKTSNGFNGDSRILLDNERLNMMNLYVVTIV